MATLYALRHVVCGHVAGVGNTPEILERVRDTTVSGWACDWRITDDATDDDLTQLISGERCPRCASARADHHNHW